MGSSAYSKWQHPIYRYHEQDSKLFFSQFDTTASNTIGGGIEQAINSGLVDSSGAGFDLNSMIGDLTQPLEVCYSTLDAAQ